jgi:hypothetical protein
MDSGGNLCLLNDYSAKKCVICKIRKIHALNSRALVAITFLF